MPVRSHPRATYHLRVRLADQRRTIELPNDIALDSTPPELVVKDAGRPHVLTRPRWPR